MKNILIPTDFTETSEHAIDWARYLAKHYGATLTLLHVTQPYIPDTTLPTGEVGAGVLVVQEMENVSEDRLHQLTTRLQREGFQVRSEARMGAIEDEVVALADETAADLIVVGRSHFDSFFDRLAGSSATDVAMTASCPVLVVPTLEEGQSAPAQLSHIVYATQLEFDENDTVQPVVQLAQTFNAKLTLLKVHADSQPGVHDEKQYLRQIKSEFGADRFVLDTVQADNVSEGLTGYIKSHAVDLLVMATRERDFLSRLLNPSLTKRMVLDSSVPMLVYHASKGY